MKPLKRERQRTINCHYPDISWNSRCLFSWSSHTNFPLFSTDFQPSTRMLIFRKQTRKQKFLSCLPLAKYLDFFYDVSKNSELIKTFREARLKSHPPKFKSLTFLNKKRKSNPKMEKFSNSFHNGVKTFTQQSREKDNLIKKLIQIF